jgi:hypothetical protein
MSWNKHDAIDAIRLVFEQRDDLDVLCGEILASLKLNMQRGHITLRNPNDTEVFMKFLDGWYLKLSEIRKVHT